MSRVFLAEETRLGRQVVVKVLPPEMGAAVNTERFEREIQLAARLQHPHVVPLLTAASSGDLLYYIMPFIAGESLRAKLGREGALPVSEAIKILREVVDALAYAHKNNVVHRDIKPDNVLLSNGHAVVTDFGVAKAVSASSGGHSSLTSLGVALGTPAYMAPEQAAADPNVDHRADIYAAGALAYEMLTGRTPFTAPTPQGMLAAHITQSPDPITRHRATVPAAVNTLIMHCLEKHPADRFQSAAELLAQLEVVLTPSGGMAPSEAVPAVSSGTAEALKRSQPVRVIGMFVGAAALTLLVVWLLVRQFGLPDWVFYGAIILLVIGLPIMLVTGHFERNRAEARATGRIVPPAVSGVHRYFTWRQSIRGGFLAFAGLAVLTVGYTGMRLLGIGSVGTLRARGALGNNDKLLIADFENHTSDSTLAGSITDAFRIDLTQSRSIKLLDAAQVRDGLQRMEKDPATPVVGAVARELATREGAKAVIAGEISSLGKSFIVSARILNAADGTELVAIRETADDDAGIVKAVDRLSARVRERVGESLKSIRNAEPLETATTNSLEALRLYSLGSHVSDQNRSSEAIRYLKQAIALDTGFALAYRKLAVVYNNSQAGTSQIVGAITKAYQHRDRLPERERLLTIGFYSSVVEGNVQGEIDAYRQILAADSTDYIAGNNLGLALMTSGRASEAVPVLASQLDDTLHGPNLRVNYAVALFMSGDTAGAGRTIEATANANPHNSFIAWVQAGMLFEKFDFAATEKILTTQLIEARDLDDRSRLENALSLTVLTQGRLADAQRHDRAVAELGAQRGIPAEAIATAAQLARWRILFLGDTAGGLRLIDEALVKTPLESIPAYDRPTAEVVAALALGGRQEKAKQLLARYESEVPVGIRRSKWAWHDARGLVALAGGDPRGAVEAFTEGRWTQSCAGCNDAELGLAYEKGGNADSALAAYSRAVSTQSSWKPLVDYYGLPLGYRRLGELYEAKGDKARALENYGKLTALWKDADPEVQPAIREVKGRMARLTSEK